MKTSARLENFPIMMFAITMGLSGLSIAYEKAAHLFKFSLYISTVLVILTTIIFIGISITYLLKFLLFRSEVKKEFIHPVRVNFFAAISLSLLLLSIAYQEVSVNVSFYLWWFGMFLQAYLTFYTISFWINHNLEIQHSNPAWFVPIVGNVLVPVGGIDIVNHNFLMYFFAIGIFFWIILLTIISQS